MAGDVGRLVKTSPGYAGYIPSWAVHLPSIKTGPNTHVDVCDRNLRSQPPKEPSRTCTNQSIYQIDMESGACRRASQLGNTEGRTATAGSQSLCGTLGPDGGESLLETQLGDIEGRTATAGSQSLCGTLGPEVGGSLKGTRPGASRELPPSKPFVGTTNLQEANASVTSTPQDKAFFSRLAKERQRAAELNTETVRRSDTLKNSQRGQGGASGLDCFHQPPAVAVLGETGFELPTQNTPLLPGANDKRGTCHPERLYGDKNNGLKLNRWNAQSSYAKEYGKMGSNPRDRMPAAPRDFAESMTTIDLAPGTTKAVSKIRVPGYMGHVPTVPSNVEKLRGDDDALMKFHKSNLMLSCQNNIPGYSGFKPRATENDTGRPMAPTLELTTSGAVSKYVSEDTVIRNMRETEFVRTNAMQGFFSRGEGEDAAAACDSYFQKYRPYEGHLKI